MVGGYFTIGREVGGLIGGRDADIITHKGSTQGFTGVQWESMDKGRDFV